MYWNNQYLILLFKSTDGTHGITIICIFVKTQSMNERKPDYLPVWFIRPLHHTESSID
jgi:hypothetical protein